MPTSVVLVLSSYATLANAKYVCDVTQSWDGSKSIEGHCDGADGAFEDTTFQPGCCADGTSGPYLSGTLPPEMGELEDLQIIWLTGNHISGTIPSELTTHTHCTSNPAPGARQAPPRRERRRGGAALDGVVEAW